VKQQLEIVLFFLAWIVWNLFLILLGAAFFAASLWFTLEDRPFLSGLCTVCAGALLAWRFCKLTLWQ